MHMRHLEKQMERAASEIDVALVEELYEEYRQCENDLICD